MKINLYFNKSMYVEISGDEIEFKINFSCNQCGNDRQIESELSQECKASGRQGQTEDFFFAQVTINKNMAMEYFCK